MVGHEGVDGLLGHLAFLNELAITFFDRGHSLIEAGLGAAFHDDGHLGGEGFHNTFGHGAGSNNVNFHDDYFYLLLSC